MSNNKDAFLIDLVHPHLLPPYFVVVFFLRYAVLLGRFMSCGSFGSFVNPSSSVLMSWL